MSEAAFRPHTAFLEAFTGYPPDAQLDSSQHNRAFRPDSAFLHAFLGSQPAVRPNQYRRARAFRPHVAPPQLLSRPLSCKAARGNCGTQIRAQQSGASHDTCHVTFVGHATVYVEMDGVALITDPLLRDRVWHLRRDTARAPDDDLTTQDISAVLLSHLHMDHADMPSLRRISSTTMIAPQGTGSYLRTRLSHRVHTMHPWQSCMVGKVEVITVPAVHSGTLAAFSSLASCAGFIIRGSSTIYFAGDTSLFTEMAELGSTFDIDLALLPVWGYGPTLRGDHMTPYDAAQALTLLRPRRALPIHWGTFRPLGKMWSRMSYFNDPPYTFANYAKRAAPNTKVHILQPGESMTL